ncbi:alpha/beta hydrolase family protein [Agromyces cerinus]|uniref:Alpha/beta hydrolase family protein n=1 Tax=Agromyces cerinus subsp. cerinus TaxID=232089 RepID=A0A1N6FZ80_9MICO|nr:alpha/beta fold hydrolase [Agromyces cerinus]SIO00636.1 Alpha/beta hydrolase family protein [Agromyces cerinus subsp. cerinus]
MSAASAIATGVRAASRVSPEAGAALALPLFMRVGRRTPVAATDLATHQAARRGTVRIPGIRGTGVDVVTYEWGAGERTVLLAHGWQSRASVFGPLIRELRSEGFRVLAFDAPANGDSPGRGTYLVDHLDVIAELTRLEGPWHALVGHSFGSLAALVATHDGTPTTRVVGIAGAADPRIFIDGFGEMLGLDRRTRDALAARFADRVLTEEPDPFERYSAVRHPLPGATPLLLVHDRGDRRVPFTESERLLEANRGHARLLATEGLGHNRVLRADATLDAVMEFLTSSDLSSVEPEATRATA